MRFNAFLFLTILPLLAACSGAKLPHGDAAFSRGEYTAASKIYRTAYNKLNAQTQRKLKGEVAYKLGVCYERTAQSARAVASFRNAQRYGYPDSTLLLHIARSLHGDAKYKEAIDAYDQFLQLNPTSEIARNGIRGCRNGLKIKEGEKTRYKVSQAKLFNSTRSDFAPMFLDKSFNTLYFTSSTEKSTGSDKSGITGTKNSDIFFSTKNEKGGWERPQPVNGELNTDKDEGVVSFSPDGQTMYLALARRTPNADSGVEIYTSKRSDASWSAPQKFEITGDTISSYGDPAVSPDGTYLYFASDMPGGYGGLDIWRINLKERGGSLENLGPQINTPGNDRFPYVRNDSVIYFASDGHPGYGGLDLFRARLNSTRERWSVENMGYPVNSAGDDFGITFGEGESGFFSSNRRDVRGYDNIYAFELPEIKISISGAVLDKDEEPVPGAIIRIVGNDGSNQKEIAREDGSFKFKLNRGVSYVMKAGAPGYLNQKQEFTSSDKEEDAEYGVDFILVAVTKPSVVENIFYDFDRATLRPESKAALDELATILRENPHVSIEMGAHTDSKGSDAYNLDLSNRRAKSVVDYLISAGIDERRLSWKGYGKSEPKTITKRINREFPQFPEDTVLDDAYLSTLSDGDRAVADQINRRTEFKVTSTNFEN